MKTPSASAQIREFGVSCILLTTLLWAAGVYADTNADTDTPEAELLLRSQAAAQRVALPEFEEDETMAQRRADMVRSQIARRGIKSQQVLDALTRVPRHRFVPEGYQRRAYDDSPLPIGHGQTISQPYIVALMTEVLQVEPDDRVLEIGAGSGYQAAILAELVREVVTIEIVEPLARSVATLFEELGYRNITALFGDGYFGWEQGAPYDAIIVTAAATHIPPPLIAQLKPGGRMVIPVGDSAWTQNLLLVKKDEQGEIRTENLMPVRFVPLTGER